jgi:hypothetical protein
LKAGYTFQEIHRRGGHHSLITWLLETAVVNFYLLFYSSCILEKEKFTNHKAFRQAIVDKCFDIGRFGKVEQRKRKSPTYTPKIALLEIPVEAHRLVFMEKRGDAAPSTES